MDYTFHDFMNNDASAENVFSDSKPTDSYSSTINEEVDISLTKNFVKRSISQSSQMNINKEIIHSRKKRILCRRSKSQGDAPSLMSGFWNWQLENQVPNKLIGGESGVSEVNKDEILQLGTRAYVR